MEILGKKSTQKKVPPGSKPNPIPNLTLTLPLTPHRGLYSWGIFSWHHNWINLTPYTLVNSEELFFLREIHIFHFVKYSSIIWIPISWTSWLTNTAQKMKFSIKNFVSKCDQICSFLQIWSHLLTKSIMENFIFRAV